MTISEVLREHALAGSDIYDSRQFPQECWDEIMRFKTPKDNLNQDHSHAQAAVVCLYILFVAEALEQS